MNAKQEILSRVRTALRDTTGQPEPVVAWQYHRPTPLADVLATFVENIVEYGASIVRVTAAEVPEAIASALATLGASSVVLPPGAPGQWRRRLADEGLDVFDDDPPLSAAELDRIDAVVTGSAVCMAETGTICLDHGPDQGRRVLTLVPDRHVCVVRAADVVSDVPEAIQRLGAAVRAGRPVTWISGGSATSDIELSRVEGVHGPRKLSVVLQDG
ncbi:MAG TPA: lactate utilization protein C [Arachnia sp.]|nr:lactate utilization protein C [Arachnia sp.]HMT86373.1 lactate utilization protein C [Arachnia sp.]